ncbi:hypothetical protein CWC48_29870 [Pseudomonas sp. S10E 269]|uniref:hypothetical protein n=2 Tax=unclassified Pseudomonas TaxID=196821 RepID=UPI000C25866F|nr:hypothetical protein [Pseudomonas sp. S10E 269]PJK37538.1 hypothetical protein CWC48_29870 [Pseudomonas sp. S10E 269]
MDTQDNLPQAEHEQAPVVTRPLSPVPPRVSLGSPKGRVEPYLPGGELSAITVTKLEVSQGVDGVFASFDLSFAGSGVSSIRTYLNPETLGVDHARMKPGPDPYPVAHEIAIDKQIQEQCRQRGIEPLIKLDDAQEWVSETLGGDFEILKTKRGIQLQGAGGIWTQQDSISDVIDHIENRLVDDVEFLRDVGKAVGYPEKLWNDRGELDYRHSAFIRSKIEAAMEHRPDEISAKISEIESHEYEEFNEVFSMKI